MNQKNLFKTAIAVVVLLTVTFANLNAQVKGVQNKEGKWGLIDASGNMITEYLYDQMGGAGIFSEGLLVVVVKNKMGYIDTTGKVIIPIKYDDCDKFKSGLASVWLADKCALLDKTGKLVIPFKYNMLTMLDENLWQSSLSTATGRKRGLINRSGKELLPAVYDMIERPSGGYGVLTLNGKKGYFDMDGKITVPCKYEEAKNFSQGIAAVALNKKWGFIDVSGRLLLPLVYDRAPYLYKGELIIIRNDEPEKFTYPKLLPPLTAKDLINNHINRIGGQIRLQAFKNYQFTLEEYNHKNILYTTTGVFFSGNNIHADIYDNNSKETTKRILTNGEMWFINNNKVEREAYETDNVFMYSLPSFLINAQKMGYAINYDPLKCKESGAIYLSIIGKEKLRTEYKFYFEDDYSIKEIEVSRGDFSYSISNIKYEFVNGILVISEWSSSQFGNEMLIWEKRKDFQINTVMDPKLFIKPI